MFDSPPGPRPAWIGAWLGGERAALARAVTAVENDAPEAAHVLAAAARAPRRAPVIGITGAPGAGKSTLVASYVAQLRARGHSVCVLAVDPSSPLTGGALLGDRIRMTRHAGDRGVFVRSLASRGHPGGLARNAAAVIDAMAVSGRDAVIVETVGVGQSEIEVAELADIRVVVWAAGAGDGVQAAKAGLIEIADFIVVNKADLPGAAATRAAMTAATSHLLPAPAVVATAALRDRGVPELADAVAALLRARRTGGRARDAPAGGRRLRAAAESLARRRLALVDDRVVDQLIAEVDGGRLDWHAAACRLLSRARSDE